MSLSAKERTRRYRAKHKTRIRENKRRYLQGTRQQSRQYAKAYRWQVKMEAIARYGGACACCGEKHPEFLAVDHPNRDGKTDRVLKGARGGTEFYLVLRKLGWPDGYRLLCHNCNQSIGFYGYCPHPTYQAVPLAPKQSMPNDPQLKLGLGGT